MTAIQKAGIPEKSIIADFLKPIDYADSYKMKIPDDCYIGIDELARKLFIGGPSWTEDLLKLRNILVAPFGLKNEMPKPKANGKELTPAIKQDYSL